jgi:hypothetical protein
MTIVQVLAHVRDVIGLGLVAVLYVGIEPVFMKSSRISFAALAPPL